MMSRTIFKDMVSIFLLTLILLIATTQTYPLLNHDEARYSEIPREMIENGDYVIPRLNGIIYLEKPPLFYWLQTLSFKTFGLNEGAARLWNAIFASLTCVFVYLAGALSYDRRTGWLASGLLFSSLLFFAMAHFITLDMSLMAWVTGCLVCLWLGLQDRYSTPEKRAWIYTSYIFAALALLTKGLVGILLPGSVFVVWMVVTRRFVLLKQIYLLFGLALFFLITLPWHWLAQARVPEFFDFYVIGQHFTRYLTSAEDRYEPVWFYIPIILAGLLPWTFFGIQAVQRSYRQCVKHFSSDSVDVFLGVWILFILLFFSFSQSKLIPYMLPILPPIFLWLAHDLLTFPRKRWEWVATLSLMLVLGIAVCIYPFVAQDRALLFVMPLLCIGFVLVVSSVLCVLLLRKQKSFSAIGLLATGAVIVYALAIPSWFSIADRSIKPLALVVRQMKGQYDELAAYREYYQDLPFYTQQVITVVSRQGELDFGMTLEDKSAYMIDEKTFTQRWHDPNHRMLLVIRRDKYEKLFAKEPNPQKILAQTSRHYLVQN